MNKEAVEEWIKALRSGKYQQSRFSLRNEDGYCCLGVACEVFKEKLQINIGVYDGFYSYNGFKTYLPGVLMDHLGIDSQLMNRLMALNDHKKWNFDEIADYLELELENAK